MVLNNTKMSVIIFQEDFFMPKTKLQDLFFTVIMVIVMVYAMICYNIALNVGGLQNFVFLSAFSELKIMGPIAFVLEFFIVGRLAQKLAFRCVDVRKSHPYSITLAISSVTVALMCPIMSFFATLLFKDAGSNFVSVWLQTTAFNFLMAFVWQIFYAGPFVRLVFRNSMKLWNKLTGKAQTEAA
jgi:hypothetical protein